MRNIFLSSSKDVDRLLKVPCKGTFDRQLIFCNRNVNKFGESDMLLQYVKSPCDAPSWAIVGWV